MTTFLVGLLVVIGLFILFFGGMLMAGVVMFLGVALLALLKVFIWLFIIVFIIWLIGKITLTVVKKDK